jgi:hypothetical protein
LFAELNSIYILLKEELITWEWIPLVSIGSLKFGEPIEPVISKFDLRKLDKPFEEADWNSYEFLGCDKRVYAEDGNITSFGCFDNLYYKGRDLLGLTLNEIRVLFGEEDKIGETVLFDFEDGEFEETPVEFYEYGLQIWLRDGVVESAMISAID